MGWDREPSPAPGCQGTQGRHIAICSTQAAAGGGNSAAGRAEPPSRCLLPAASFPSHFHPARSRTLRSSGPRVFLPTCPSQAARASPAPASSPLAQLWLPGSSLTFNYASCLRKPLARPSLCSPLHRNKLLIKLRAGIPRCLCALKLRPGLKIRSGYRGAVTGCGDAPPPNLAMGLKLCSPPALGEV